MTATSIEDRRDEGLTLVEMVIVITIIGGVMAVITAVMLVILKVTPSAEYRIDDARSTRGLQTWLARDIASTPPEAYDSLGGTGFVDAGTTLDSAGVPLGDRCAPAGGTHVLFMAWEDGAVSYRAQYTIEPGGGSHSVVRRLCGGDSGSLSLTGGVLDLPCPSDPHSELTVTDADSDGEIEAVVELCFLSAEREGTDTQPVTLSVASRNGDS